MPNKNKTLRFLLGDQLNLNHSWFKKIDNDLIYVMMEVRQETDYVMHHIQKVLAFFAAMREFARQLRDNGHQVLYIKLDDPDNTQSIPKNLSQIIQDQTVARFEYQLPDEYRLDVQMRQFCKSLPIPWQALEMLMFFNEHCLPYFGRYEDAMTKQHWAMFHARLSFALNTKMLHPMETVEAALQSWQQNKSRITLPQIEAFVRQIIGWREYMRGVYWAQMPEYEKMNFFAHDRKLPHYYWDGETNMQCLRYCIAQSLKYAFVHHTQRLMITGNFALLAGVHPDEVDAWYLGIYIDAIQWVEITNTRGISQFADGGIIATKPYISSAKYIQKMSDYCSGCFYDPNKRYGDRACPFNSLYWTFYDRHRDRLSKNPRIAMMYRVLDRFSVEERSSILKQGRSYLERIEDL